MDESLSRRAEDLFARVHDLDPEERTRFVDRACGDDAALRREVDALLAMADDSARYFDGLSERLGIHRLVAELEASADRGTVMTAGQTLGHYTVTELVGAGGM